MNSKTAKLINRYAAKERIPAKPIKRRWLETPRPFRSGIREYLRAGLAFKSPVDTY